MKLGTATLMLSFVASLGGPAWAESVPTSEPATTEAEAPAGSSDGRQPGGSEAEPAAAAEATAAEPQSEEEAARRAKLAAEYDRITAEAEGVSSSGEPLEFGRALFQMVVVLGLVCLLAYFTLGKVLPRMMRVDVPASGGRRVLKVIDRLPIDPKRSLMVVKVGEECFFVGATEQQIGLIARLEPDQIDAALMASPDDPKPFDRLGRLFKRNTEETI